jgi:hypothetical protein
VIDDKRTFFHEARPWAIAAAIKSSEQWLLEVRMRRKATPWTVQAVAVPGSWLLDLIRHTRGSLSEFLDPLAKAFGKLRNSLGAKQNQYGCEYDQHFAASHTHQC